MRRFAARSPFRTATTFQTDAGAAGSSAVEIGREHPVRRPVRADPTDERQGRERPRARRVRVDDVGVVREVEEPGRARGPDRLAHRWQRRRGVLHDPQAGRLRALERGRDGRRARERVEAGVPEHEVEARRPGIGERRPAVDRSLPHRASRRLPHDRELAAVRTRDEVLSRRGRGRRGKQDREQRQATDHQGTETWNAAVSVIEGAFTMAAWNVIHGPDGSAGIVNVRTDVPDGPVHASEFRKPGAVPSRTIARSLRFADPEKADVQRSDSRKDGVVRMQGSRGDEIGNVRGALDGEHERRARRAREEERSRNPGRGSLAERVDPAVEVEGRRRRVRLPVRRHEDADAVDLQPVDRNRTVVALRESDPEVRGHREAVLRRERREADRDLDPARGEGRVVHDLGPRRRDAVVQEEAVLGVVSSPVSFAQ